MPFGAANCIKTRQRDSRWHKTTVVESYGAHTPSHGCNGLRLLAEIASNESANAQKIRFHALAAHESNVMLASGGGAKDVLGGKGVRG